MRRLPALISLLIKLQLQSGRMESNNQASDRKRVMDELIKGLDSANQLLQLVLKWNADGASTTPSAEDLVRNILRSLTNSIFLLDTMCQSHDEFSVRDSCRRTLKCPKSTDLEQSSDALTTKNRRGCYKRKRNIPTWTKETTTEVDDGHAWRKYGQKRILSVKYLRNYYRCTHKYEKGCQAIKQVQRIQEDPPLFHTTYYGHHTCSSLQYSDVILDYPDFPSDSSILLSFNNTLPIPSKQDHPFKFSSPKIELKHESQETNPNYQYMVHNQLSSNGDYIPNPHELSLDSSGLVSSFVDINLGNFGLQDVVSCLMIESAEVDEVLKPFGL